MRIAFAYNLRHSYASINDPESQLEADFDDQNTINSIVKHLKDCGHEVIRIEANEKAYFKLYKYRKKIDLLFNYSLGLNGRDRYSHIPAMCEMLMIPYTGSGPLAQATIMNKARAKEVLVANKVPTLPFQLFVNENDILNNYLKYPLIVKPVGQGSSAGITNKSVVTNSTQLKRQLKNVIDIFGEEALVEPFIDGREFSVSMLGNPPEILPIIESDHSILPKSYQPIDSLEVEWEFEVDKDASNLICPANLDKKLTKNIKKICFDVWRVLNIKDICRIDLRCDKNENIYVLEVNSPPGLIPEDVFLNSYLPLSSRAAGLKYNDILNRLIKAASFRYNIIV